MKHIKGDLVAAFEGDRVNIMMHQVNCMGVMNSGIAKQIRQKYPQHFTDYSNDLRQSGRNNFFGSYVCTKLENGAKIIGVAGQYNFGNCGRYTNYVALVEAICDYIIKDSRGAMVIGIPKYIGCGLGGGSWSIVEQLLTDIEGMYDWVEFVVYEL